MQEFGNDHGRDITGLDDSVKEHEESYSFSPCIRMQINNFDEHCNIGDDPHGYLYDDESTDILRG